MLPDHAGLPTPTAAAPSTPDTGADTATRLLALLRALLLEIHQSDRAAALAPDSHLERDLALDSLARTELLRRIEHAFGVTLNEQMLLAETPRDLLNLIRQASGQP